MWSNSVDATKRRHWEIENSNDDDQNTYCKIGDNNLGQNTYVAHYIKSNVPCLYNETINLYYYINMPTTLISYYQDNDSNQSQVCSAFYMVYTWLLNILNNTNNITIFKYTQSFQNRETNEFWVHETSDKKIRILCYPSCLVGIEDSNTKFAIFSPSFAIPPSMSLGISRRPDHKYIAYLMGDCIEIRTPNINNVSCCNIVLKRPKPNSYYLFYFGLDYLVAFSLDNTILCWHVGPLLEFIEFFETITLDQLNLLSSIKQSLPNKQFSYLFQDNNFEKVYNTLPWTIKALILP